ncbi:hypothetical protein SLEP1_g4613 [Rubroshorea leprosula]|uniref:Cytochrome P450 n=1 Tax=Rubroshorea leprosula TaxID=152421 RepID=A0AAV5HY38_9ROSI|nr:hypothetical protein SLEP1_g4613 [Rubroshorea leprosula]
MVLSSIPIFFTDASLIPKPLLLWISMLYKVSYYNASFVYSVASPSYLFKYYAHSQHQDIEEHTREISAHHPLKSSELETGSSSRNGAQYLDVHDASVHVCSLSFLFKFVYCKPFTFFFLHSSTSPEAMDQIPGNLGWPVVGESVSFVSNFSSPSGIFNFMNERQQRYGKAFKTRVLGRLMVFMTGREASEMLLTGKDGMVSLNLFYKGQQSGNRNIGSMVRTGILDLEEASTFTLKVKGNMIMSLEPTGEGQEKFRANFKIISSYFASLPLNIPGTGFYHGLKARDRMHAMIDSIIAKRRNGEVFRQDFLQSLIMRHSHDTTTAGLAWLIKFHGENPDVLEQLRMERQEIKANRKDGAGEKLLLINETFRRATILPGFSGIAAQDFEIDGYSIKKGWSVNLDVVSIHHDPGVFPDPQKFDPSRFNAPLRPFSFLGFGSGPRMCP